MNKITIITNATALAQEVIGGITPSHSRAILSATIGAACAMIPDDLWDRMVEESGTPCGIPMCDCHIGTEQLFIALGPVRSTSVDVKQLAEQGIER